MPGLLNSSTSSISVDFTDMVPGGHTLSISGMQFLPASEGGRKLRGIVVVDQGQANEFRTVMTVTIRDLVYDEFGIYGDRLDAEDRKKLVIKF